MYGHVYKHVIIIVIIFIVIKIVIIIIIILALTCATLNELGRDLAVAVVPATKSSITVSQLRSRIS